MPVEGPGIVCRSCGCRHHYTVRTQPASGNRIRRIRKCRNCQRQQVTYETAAFDPVDELALTDLTPKQREGVVAAILRAMRIGS